MTMKQCQIFNSGLSISVAQLIVKYSRLTHVLWFFFVSDILTMDLWLSTNIMHNTFHMVQLIIVIWLFMIQIIINAVFYWFIFLCLSAFQIFQMNVHHIWYLLNPTNPCIDTFLLICPSLSMIFCLNKSLKTQTMNSVVKNWSLLKLCTSPIFWPLSSGFHRPVFKTNCTNICTPRDVWQPRSYRTLKFLKIT